MKRTKLLAASALLLVVMAALLAWQHQALRREQMETARLQARAAELDAALEENTRLQQVRPDSDELERGRKALAELPRLRGELASLRQQIKEARRIAAVLPAPPAKATPAPPDEPPAAPVETYTAAVRARLAPGQTLVTGGWTTPEGKRALFFIELEFGAADSAGQVMIRTRIMEMPDDVFAQLGLDALRSDNKQTSGQAILNPEQTAAAVKTLEGTAGVDVLAAPRISTADGRQAQIKVAEVRFAPSGETFETGPLIEVTPHLSADGASVDLNVSAQLRYARPVK